jgi:hypothetical protein
MKSFGDCGKLSKSPACQRVKYIGAQKPGHFQSSENTKIQKRVFGSRLRSGNGKKLNCYETKKNGAACCQGMRRHCPRYATLISYGENESALEI